MSSDYERTSVAIEYLATQWRAPPSLDEVAAHVGLSRFHFQRLFRRMTGVSPKRFSQSLAADHSERLILAARPVHEVTHEIGLSSPGRLHDLMVSIRGMTPGEIKRGGAGLTLRYGVHGTPFGECLVVLTSRGVCELAFVAPGADIVCSLQERWPHATLEDASGETGALVSRIMRTSGGGGPLTLHVSGTNFQLRVWKALLSIPYGQVTSYAGVARSIGEPESARAVGGAVARNPVAMLIPCHRVLLANGALGNYRWTPLRKRALLAWEDARSRNVVEGEKEGSSSVDRVG